MRETHPIDDFFRDAIYNASATPPAHIGEAVIAAVRAKRRAAIWRRSIAGLVILLLLVGGGVVWNAQHEEPLAHDAQAVPKSPEPGMLVRSETTEGPAGKSLPGGDTDQEDEHGQDALRGSAPPIASKDSHVGQRPVALTGAQSADPSSKNAPRGIHEPMPPALQAEALLVTEAGSGEPVVREDFQVQRMEHLPRPSASSGVPETAAAYDGPIVPRGSWWVAPAIGAYASRYSWSGGDTELAAALDRSREWRGDVSIGLFGGRAWRSGLVLSGGVEWQRTEQLFRASEHVTTMEAASVDLVTLNTFIIAADTNWTAVEQEHTTEGTDRRSVLRIPMELAWHYEIRRWLAGPRIGLAGEVTSVHASSSLVWSEEDGRVRAGSLSSDGLHQRYPFVVLGVLGLDLGYLVHEHWSLVASPSYCLPAFDFGSSSTTHATAEHLGFRLQLRHTF